MLVVNVDLPALAHTPDVRVRASLTSSSASTVALVLNAAAVLHGAGWNIVDFTVVALGFVDIFSSGNLTALRTVRVLRPLRAITRIRGMRVRLGTGEHWVAAVEACGLRRCRRKQRARAGARVLAGLGMAFDHLASGPDQPGDGYGQGYMRDGPGDQRSCVRASDCSLCAPTQILVTTMIAALPMLIDGTPGVTCCS